MEVNVRFFVLLKGRSKKEMSILVYMMTNDNCKKVFIDIREVIRGKFMLFVLFGFVWFGFALFLISVLILPKFLFYSETKERYSGHSELA